MRKTAVPLDGTVTELRMILKAPLPYILGIPAFPTWPAHWQPTAVRDWFVDHTPVLPLCAPVSVCPMNPKTVQRAKHQKKQGKQEDVAPLSLFFFWLAPPFLLEPWLLADFFWEGKARHRYPGTGAIWPAWARLYTMLTTKQDDVYSE